MTGHHLSIIMRWPGWEQSLVVSSLSHSSPRLLGRSSVASIREAEEAGRDVRTEESRQQVSYKKWDACEERRRQKHGKMRRAPSGMGPQAKKQQIFLYGEFNSCFTSVQNICQFFCDLTEHSNSSTTLNQYCQLYTSICLKFASDIICQSYQTVSGCRCKLHIHTLSLHISFCSI